MEKLNDQYFYPPITTTTGKHESIKDMNTDDWTETTNGIQTSQHHQADTTTIIDEPHYVINSTNFCTSLYYN